MKKIISILFLLAVTGCAVPSNPELLNGKRCLVEGDGIFEGLHQGGHRRNVPVPNVLIESGGPVEGILHTRDQRGIPITDVLIKLIPKMKDPIQIGNRRSIPVTDVPIGGIGLRLIIEP